MSSQKKIYYVSFFFLFFFTFFIPQTIQAQLNINDEGPTKKIESNLDALSEKAGFEENTDSFTFIAALAKILGLTMFLLGFVFLGLTLYGGFLWMTAQGNEEQVKEAVQMIRNGTIGVLIVLSAYSLSYFIAKNILKSTQEISDETNERIEEESEGSNWEPVIDELEKFGQFLKNLGD